MEMWHWIETFDGKFFVSEESGKRGVKFSVRDCMDAVGRRDYSGLKAKYLLSDADISLVRTALKTGHWSIKVRPALN